MLAWGGEAGRADAGDASAPADLDAFYRDQIIVPSTALWRQLGDALGELYGQPNRRIAELDEALADDVRSLHWDGLGAFWNPLFEGALRRGSPASF
jgi:hypothetical protein